MSRLESTECCSSSNIFENSFYLDGADIGKVAYVSFGGLGVPQTENQEETSEDGPMREGEEEEGSKMKAKKEARSRIQKTLFSWKLAKWAQEARELYKKDGKVSKGQTL